VLKIEIIEQLIVTEFLWQSDNSRSSLLPKQPSPGRCHIRFLQESFFTYRDRWGACFLAL